MLQRLDVHKPSVINPSDYEYVGQSVVKIQGIEDCLVAQEERRRINEHMERTGGTYSKHAHGGNCMVCGNANAIFTHVFHHAPSNTYVRVGEDCANKLDFCVDGSVFRKEVNDYRKAMAGKKKAKTLLHDHNLSECWEIYEASYGEYTPLYQENTIRSIVGKLVSYGDLSDKQWSFLGNLLDQIDKREEITEKRKVEKSFAKDCPIGKSIVTGTVIKTDIKETYYGIKEVWTVRDDSGFVVWGTIPKSCYEAQKGDKVQFSADFTPSDNDPKFGFYKRPTQGKCIA